jgi:hypothetical protein
VDDKLLLLFSPPRGFGLVTTKSFDSRGFFCVRKKKVKENLQADYDEFIETLKEA